MNQESYIKCHQYSRTFYEYFLHTNEIVVPYLFSVAESYSGLFAYTYRNNRFLPDIHLPYYNIVWGSVRAVPYFLESYFQATHIGFQF